MEVATVSNDSGHPSCHNGTGGFGGGVLGGLLYQSLQHCLRSKETFAKMEVTTVSGAWVEGAGAGCIHMVQDAACGGRMHHLLAWSLNLLLFTLGHCM
jgi:hypothetical protein